MIIILIVIKVIVIVIVIIIRRIIIRSHFGSRPCDSRESSPCAETAFSVASSARDSVGSRRCGWQRHGLGNTYSTFAARCTEHQCAAHEGGVPEEMRPVVMDGPLGRKGVHLLVRRALEQVAGDPIPQPGSRTRFQGEGQAWRWRGHW